MGEARGVGEREVSVGYQRRTPTDGCPAQTLTPVSCLCCEAGLVYVTPYLFNSYVPEKSELLPRWDVLVLEGPCEQVR